MAKDETIERLAQLGVDHGYMSADPGGDANQPKISANLVSLMQTRFHSPITDLYAVVQFYTPLENVNFRILTEEQQKLAIGVLRKTHDKIMGHHRHLVIAVSRSGVEGDETMDEAVKSLDCKQVTLGKF